MKTKLILMLVLIGFGALAQQFTLTISRGEVPNYGRAMLVQINGDSNTTYVIESSSNMVNWDDLYRISGNSSLIVPTNKTSQFYRARILQ